MWANILGRTVHMSVFGGDAGEANEETIHIYIYIYIYILIYKCFSAEVKGCFGYDQ